MKKILCVAMVILLYGGCAFADVAIDETNFPDENFRNYIAYVYDTNKDGILDPREVRAVKDLQVHSQRIQNLKGVEYFTALTRLSCSSNQLTELDISKNTALTYLSCGYNQLSALNVNNNTALTEIHCIENFLTTLDLSNNTALERLYCPDN